MGSFWGQKIIFYCTFEHSKFPHARQHRVVRHVSLHVTIMGSFWGQKIIFYCTFEHSKFPHARQHRVVRHFSLHVTIIGSFWGRKNHFTVHSNIRNSQMASTLVNTGLSVTLPCTWQSLGLLRAKESFYWTFEHSKLPDGLYARQHRVVCHVTLHVTIIGSS